MNDGTSAGIPALPPAVADRIRGEAYTENTVGLSAARVLIFGNKVLKIQPHRPWADREADILRWLDGRLPAPRLLAYETEADVSFCLMTRVPGRMACDDAFLNRPELLLRRLAESIRLLWSVDTDGCPALRTAEKELAEARYRVENGLVDMDRTEPETFGPGGFRDPEALLRWLEDNRPDPDPVFSHGDCCLPNILLTETGIGGFIDLGDAGVGDRWRDLTLCHRSLRHNTDGTFGKRVPGVDADRLFSALGIRPDPEKLRWYLLLDELF